MSNETIPSTTRETIIVKDIERLKTSQQFLNLSRLQPKPLRKPKPISVKQMLVFQTFAIFQYLKRFKGSATDTALYDFMAELFRNLYQDTVLEDSVKDLTGEILKKSFIDNADKLRGKYEELEKAIKPF